MGTNDTTGQSQHHSEGNDEEETAADKYENVDSEDSSHSTDNLPPAKKRRRVSLKVQTGASKKGKGKTETKLFRGKNVGRLAMMYMPVDIFCEIASHLEPIDLLRLARSTRPLNEMLMSRNSKPIWRVARRYYTDLPDCPPDLSEPAYARLVFERVCHVCLAPRSLKVDYVLRVRLCHRCRRQPNIVRGPELLKTMPGLTTQLLECITGQKQAGRLSLYYYAPRVKALVARFYSAIPPGIPEEEAKILREEFYAEQKKMIENVEQNARDIERWVISGSREKQVEAHKAESRRVADIQSKLLGLGYRVEDFPESLREWDTWKALVYQPRDLTARIWIQIRPKLEASIRREKLIRAREARINACWDRIVAAIIERLERDKTLGMTITSVYNLPSVKALWEEDGGDGVTTRVKWDAAWEKIENEMDQFAVEARNSLINLIRASNQDSHDDNAPAPSAYPVDDEKHSDHDMVTLHATYFKCNECFRSSLKYPALLLHHHTVDSMILDHISTKYAPSLLSSFTGHYNEEGLRAMEARLQCSRCEDSILPMNWVELLEHFWTEQLHHDLAIQDRSKSSVNITLFNDHALEDKSPKFVVLGVDEARVAKDTISQHGFRVWECCICSRKEYMSPEAVKSHIRRNHLKEPESTDLQKVLPLRSLVKY